MDITIKFLLVLCSIFFLSIFTSGSVFAYHATNYKIGSFIEIATDTHSVITEKAYALGGINSQDYPDLVKSEFQKEIFKGDSDEKEAHQGSDKLAGNTQAMLAWFGAPELHWKKLLEDYKNKKFKEVYHRVGVLLHITADATSPPHVRICPHGAGGEEYFGSTSKNCTNTQPTYTSSIIPFPLSLLYNFHIDNFERRTDFLAIRNQIPLEPNLLPITLSDPTDYMQKAREEMKQCLDSNPYWDDYWTKKAGFVGWGTYGKGKDTFGKFPNTDDKMVFTTFNRAIAYTSGQLQVISKKLSPIIENLVLTPAKFDDQGAELSFLVLENRTKTVKVEITVDKGGPLVDSSSNVYNGKFSLELETANANGELPYSKKYTTLWKGGILNGRIKTGEGKITLKVTDEDGNPSNPISFSYEYLGKSKTPEATPLPMTTSVQDQSVKTVGQAPVVNLVSNAQLHGDYEETPHRYLLKVSASDPEGGPLFYTWNINCGYFVDQSTSSQVEWRYNTPGECVNATVVVTVKDKENLTNVRSQKVF